MNVLAAAEELARSKVLYNTPWQWTALLIVLLGSFVVSKSISMLLARQVRRMKEHNRLDLLRVLINAMVGPVATLFLAAGLYFAQTFMTLDVIIDDNGQSIQPNGPIRLFWMQVAQTIAALGVAWFIYRLVEVVDHVVNRWAENPSNLFARQLAPLIRKTLRVFVVVIAGLFVAQNIFEMNVGALLAGLGIGGLALALAAQDALSNFFGSVVILTDQPFGLGDHVRIGPHDGKVQEIGFRSTKLVLLTGEQVTIPNSIVSKEAVQNVSRRASIRRLINIGLIYGTPPAKVRRAVEILKDILAQHQANLDPNNPPQVFFNEFKSDNLNIIAYCWFVPPDWWQFLAVNERINLQLLERFNSEGIEFAFPTQTLHLQDKGMREIKLQSPKHQPDLLDT